AAERLQQPVVAAAAAHRPQGFPRVELLEHDPGVVGEPANDREVHRDEIPEPHRLQGSHGLAQRLTCLLATLYLAERGQYGVEPTQRRDFEHGIRFPFPDARFPSFWRRHVLRVTLALID